MNYITDSCELIRVMITPITFQVQEELELKIKDLEVTQHKLHETEQKLQDATNVNMLSLEEQYLRRC